MKQDTSEPHPSCRQRFADPGQGWSRGSIGSPDPLGAAPAWFTTWPGVNSFGAQGPESNRYVSFETRDFKFSTPCTLAAHFQAFPAVCEVENGSQGPGHGRLWHFSVGPDSAAIAHAFSW